MESRREVQEALLWGLLNRSGRPQGRGSAYTEAGGLSPVTIDTMLLLGYAEQGYGVWLGSSALVTGIPARAGVVVAGLQLETRTDKW